MHSRKRDTRVVRECKKTTEHTPATVAVTRARSRGSLELKNAALVAAFFVSAPAAAWDMADLDVPDGFKMSVFAEGVENARQMAWSDQGVLFAGSRSAGNVYALPDSNGDGKADEVITIASGLRRPSGIALRDGDLYVADVSRILRFENVLDNLQANAPYEVVYDDFPEDGHHGWKYLRFAPDGRLTVPVGAPCNKCDPEPPFAAIHLLDLASGEREMIARGVRNTVGFDYHPETGRLWFTENGTDMMGNEFPPDELNVLTREGQHFGYPHVHGEGKLDEEFGDGHDPDDYAEPVAIIPAHFAPLGMTFYRGDAFPEKYHHSVLIAEHGSWNRSPPGGYRVTAVLLDEQRNPVGYEVLADGWLTRGIFGHDVHGRPADVLELPDGSVLISDDEGDRIYRLEYVAEREG